MIFKADSTQLLDLSKTDLDSKNRKNPEIQPIHIKNGDPWWKTVRFQ